MKKLFIRQLCESAQNDIRSRLEALGDSTDEEIEEAMDDKIDIIIPAIEEAEQDRFCESINWMNDDDWFDRLLQEFYNAQCERRRWYV